MGRPWRDESIFIGHQNTGKKEYIFQNIKFRNALAEQYFPVLHETNFARTVMSIGFQFSRFSRTLNTKRVERHRDAEKHVKQIFTEQLFIQQSETLAKYTDINSTGKLFKSTRS